jgi:hypothetical protein
MENTCLHSEFFRYFIDIGGFLISIIVRTLDLVKQWIVCLNKKPSFYLFKAELNSSNYPNNEIDGMIYIRVRLLAPNFLGVKKLKEEIRKISKI